MKSFETMLATMTKPWAILASSGLIALSILYIDRPIAYYFRDLNVEFLIPFLALFTQLGLGGVYLVPLALLALFFRFVYRNTVWEERAWFLWLCVLFPSIVCLILKMILGRARPDLAFHDNLYGFYGWKTQAAFWSFPSGHTTVVMGFIFGLCALLPRYCYAFILLGLTVALSRILLTYHYLSDVMAATYLALLEVGLLIWWLRGRQLLTHGIPSEARDLPPVAAF